MGTSKELREDLETIVLEYNLVRCVHTWPRSGRGPRSNTGTTKLQIARTPASLSSLT